MFFRDEEHTVMLHEESKADIRGTAWSLSIKNNALYSFKNICSEMMYHRFFAIPVFQSHFRSCNTTRKLFVLTSANFSSRFHVCTIFWKGSGLLAKLTKQDFPSADCYFDILEIRGPDL